MINKIIYIIKNPLNILKSIFYSLKFSNKKLYSVPILCTWNSKIKTNKKGKIIIGNRLNMGMRDTQISIAARLMKSPPLINIGKNGTFNIVGSFILYSGLSIIIDDNARIEIGNKTYLSFNSLIIAKESIKIGDNCAISWNVNIIDSDFHNIINNKDSYNEVEPITIGDRV